VVKIKYQKFIVCLLAITSICVLFCISFITDNYESVSPSYIVLNKWHGENGRRFDIINSELKKSATFHSKLPDLSCSQTKLIFKTENLRFMLYTNGKIIFSNTDKKLSGYGEQIHIIDISEFKRGSEIKLYISPINNLKSKISSDIILTSKSDFLFSLSVKNIKILIICVLLLIASISAFIYGFIRLIQKNKAAPKNIYFSCCLIMICLTLLLKNDISVFIIRNPTIRYILPYTVYSQLGVFISSYLCSKLKMRSRLSNIISCIILAYSIFRIILFAVLLIPLSKAIIISHILLITSIILALPAFAGRADFTADCLIPFSYRILYSR
jgi:hypothetical protein